MEKIKKVRTEIKVLMAVGIFLVCVFLGIIPGIILAIICYLILKQIKKKNAQECVVLGEKTEDE